MTTRPILYPDANDRNRDWIKILGWDLPTDLGGFLRAIGGPDKLEHFLTLSAAEAMPQELRDALASLELSEFREELHPRGGKNKGWFKKKLPKLKPWAFWDEGPTTDRLSDLMTGREHRSRFLRDHPSTEELHQLQVKLAHTDLRVDAGHFISAYGMTTEERVKAKNALRVAQVLKDDPEIAAAQRRWVEKWDAQGDPELTRARGGPAPSNYVSPSLLGQMSITAPMRWHLGVAPQMPSIDSRINDAVEVKMRELLLKHFAEIKKSPPEEGFTKTTRAQIKKMGGEKLRGLYAMIAYQLLPTEIRLYRPADRKMPEFMVLRSQVEDEFIRNDPATFAEMVAQTVVLNWAQTANDEDKLAWLVQRAADKEFEIEDPFYMVKPDRGESESESFRYAEGVFALQPDAEMLIRKVLRAQYVITQKELADAGIKEAVIYRGMSNVYTPDLLPFLKHLGGGERFTIEPQELDSWQGKRGEDLYPPEVVGGSQPLTVEGVYGHLIVGQAPGGLDRYYIEIADYGPVHTSPPVEIPLSPDDPLIALVGHRAIDAQAASSGAYGVLGRETDFDPIFTYAPDYRQDMASVIRVRAESGENYWLPAERFVTAIDRPIPPPKPWSTTGEQPGQFAPLSSWTDDYGTGLDFGGSSTGGVMIAAMVPAERIHSLSTTGFGSYDEREVVVIGGKDQIFAVPGGIVGGHVVHSQEAYTHEKNVGDMYSQMVKSQEKHPEPWDYDPTPSTSNKDESGYSTQWEE
jgi:hypothetical protein